MKIPGFDYDRFAVGDITLNVASAGAGSPIVLLHGFPQTHLMWRHVAADLAGEHRVIVPDLRGYGDSDKPAETDGSVYGKRAMAADIVNLMKALGHDRFALAGHDRGALVAVRAGLDHPDSITHLMVLDVVPTADMWEVLNGTSAAIGWHLYLMAQPPGLPEQLIAGNPDLFFGHFLDMWTKNPSAIPPEVRTVYLKASREAITSIVADYRASANIDVAHDLQDRANGRRLAMPVSVLQQDFGDLLPYDQRGVWAAWAPDLVHGTTQSGHFMAEENPKEIANALRALLRRTA